MQQEAVALLQSGQKSTKLQGSQKQQSKVPFSEISSLETAREMKSWQETMMLPVTEVLYLVIWNL